MITENGWPSCGPNDLDDSPIPGTNERVPLQRGQPNIVLKAFMGALNKYVEAAVDSRGGPQDEGGWTGTNSVPTSNHLGGTAFDYNWRDHPMGPKVPDPAAGWQGSELTNWQPEEPRIRELLRYFTYDGLQLVWWANDWDSPNDSMHFQMGYRTFGDPRVQKFIDECINPLTGLPKFFEDKGLQAVDLVPTLSELMGNTVGVDYAYYLPLWRKTCHDSNANSVKRIAMLACQLGEESAGFKYMQEIADGSAYEGRCNDLGNCHPGDGRKYKGRGPIQVTGRKHYEEFSQWAYDHGIVSSPTYFVDNPEELAKPEYGFEAVTWYVTEARPTFMQAADDMDVIEATHLVNGGENGLQDRQFRYSRAIQIGNRLLAFLDTEESWMDQVNIDRLNKAIDKILGGGSMPPTWQTRGMFSLATDSIDGVDDTVGMLLNTDANAWNLIVVLGFLLGVPDDVQRVKDTAAGKIPEGAFVDENEWLKERAITFAQLLLPLEGSWAKFFGAVNEAASNIPGIDASKIKGTTDG